MHMVSTTREKGEITSNSSLVSQNTKFNGLKKWVGVETENENEN